VRRKIEDALQGFGTRANSKRHGKVTADRWNQ
jgi:hypothetical protein